MVDVKGEIHTIDFAAHFLPGQIPEGNFKSIESEYGPIYRDFNEAKKVFESAGLDGAVLSWNRYFGNNNLEETRIANNHLI